MRRAGQIDGNQPGMVKALRRMGFSVQPLSAVGNGVPDLLVGSRDRNVLLELKDPAQDPCKRKLTPAQAIWHRDWRGQKAVVETLEQALEVLNG